MLKKTYNQKRSYNDNNSEYLILSIANTRKPTAKQITTMNIDAVKIKIDSNNNKNDEHEQIFLRPRSWCARISDIEGELRQREL